MRRKKKVFVVVEVNNDKFLINPIHLKPLKGEKINGK